MNSDTSVNAKSKTMIEGYREFSSPNDPRAFHKLSESSKHDQQNFESAAPPIDPTIFSNLIEIRRLVDDAADLAVRAMSGAPPGDPEGLSLRTTSAAMSRTRQARMRELAVSKLARAYRIDEIATAVVTMQSASAIDDVAAQVLKKSPNNLEALYVHFFHEKIPSRMLAQSTTTEALDKIIAASPSTAEFFRTRGIVNSFKENYVAALKDLNTGLSHIKHQKRMRIRSAKTTAIDHRLGEVDYSATESQLYFLRGACYAEYATSVMQKYVSSGADTPKPKKKKKNKKKKKPAVMTPYGNGHAHVTTVEQDFPEADTDTAKPDDPEAPSNELPDKTPDGLADEISEEQLDNGTASADLRLLSTNEHIISLSRKAIRDLSHFLSFYPNNLNADVTSLVVTPKYSSNGSSTTPPEIITTYHPLLTEAYYLLLLCHTMQLRATESPIPLPESPRFDNDEVETTAETHKPSTPRTNAEIIQDMTKLYSTIRAIQEHVEGYPVFLPARSMAQADWIKIFGEQDATNANGPVPSLIQHIRKVDSKMAQARSTDISPALVKLDVRDTPSQPKSTTQYPLTTPRAEMLTKWLQILSSHGKF